MNSYAVASCLDDPVVVVVGYISRSYRRARSQPLLSRLGRCSPRKRSGARLPRDHRSCASRRTTIPLDLCGARGPCFRRNAKCERLIFSRSSPALSTSDRYGEHELCRVSNCAPGIRIMFLNFGVSRSGVGSAWRIVGRRDHGNICEFIRTENTRRWRRRGMEQEASLDITIRRRSYATP